MRRDAATTLRSLLPEESPEQAHDITSHGLGKGEDGIYELEPGYNCRRIVGVESVSEREVACRIWPREAVPSNTRGEGTVRVMCLLLIFLPAYVSFCCYFEKGVYLGASTLRCCLLVHTLVPARGRLHLHTTVRRSGDAQRRTIPSTEERDT